MKYFIDTHDKTKGSFPAQELTEEEFFANFDSLDEAGTQFGAFGHAAHVNLKDGKAFCFMSGPDEELIRKAHAAINFPYELDHRGETRDRCRYAPSAGGGSAAAEGAITHAAMKGWELPVRRFRRHPRRC